jgi:RNA polymerase sigma factor (TIGR02999 family)
MSVFAVNPAARAQNVLHSNVLAPTVYLGDPRPMRQDALEQLIKTAETGDPQARQQLFVTLYTELRRMAERELKRNASLTLSPTTLLHETYLSLRDRNSAVFADRAQFMAYAARAMRGLVIDYLRSRAAQKRGGGFEITSLPTDVPEPPGDDTHFEKLNEALEQLEGTDARLAQLVDLKFFCGFSFSEIGELLGMSPRTAQRDWDKARILLHRFLKDENMSLE